MSELTCAMDNIDDGSGWYWEPADGVLLFDGKRRKRCCSCKAVISPGDTVYIYETWRTARNDIEERICGNEILMAPKYACEECGDIAENLGALGYDVCPCQDMRELLRQYQELVEKNRKPCPQS